MKTTIEFALQNENIRDEIIVYLKEVVQIGEGTLVEN